MIRLSIHKIKISFWICGFSFIILTILVFYTHSLSEQIENTQTHLSSLKKVAVQSQESTVFLQTHQEESDAFEACRFMDPVTLETLQSTLPYQGEWGEVSYLNGLLENKKLMTQAVSFSVPCLKDRDIFKFLELLTQQGPGIFLIHEVKVNRICPLNDEILEKIAAGKMQILFEGRIRATWVHQ